MKRVLITGAAGFLGSHLCDRFIKDGYHVLAMDNLITGRLKNIEHLFHLEQLSFITMMFQNLLMFLENWIIYYILHRQQVPSIT